MASSIDADFFREVGEFLYGSQFQRSLAKAIGRSERMIHRYVSGESPVTDEVWAALALLLRAHEERLCHLGDQLVSRVKP